MQCKDQHADNSLMRNQQTTLHADESGATTLEWALLLAAVALPSYWTIRMALHLLTDHYRMMTMINSLPFP